jgi:hypothetical protein
MSRKSSVEKCVVDKLREKPRLRVAAKYLANTGEVEAFVAGVAACASNVFGRPITAREVEKCISGIKGEDGFYGGAAIVLEGLADAYVVTAVDQEGLPTIYPATRKVSINMFARVAHTDGIVCPQVTSVPPLFEEAETALVAWDAEPSAENHERMVELYETIRWNEKVWRTAGEHVFQMYQRVCRLLESAVDEGNRDARG